MTHDELLTDIEKLTVIDGIFMKDALRAVVELTNKDIEHESYVWLDGYDYAMKQIIQVIEKELQ